MKKVYVAAFLIGLGLAIAFHQYVVFHKWFSLSDVHHETFVLALIFGGVVALVM